MKKLALVTVLATLSTGSFAASDAGCGVGTMIFEGKEGIGPNVLAATTNGTFGNQTFGMTTGTLGCDNSNANGVWAMNDYLDSNIDKVARDMSRGQGEALDGLAAVMGVADQDKGTFFEVSKQNFDRIFSSADATRAEVVAALAEVMSEHADLAQYAPQV